ncbi:hypothetical protein SAMN05421684_7927 [Asanoa ishikariensis]|uniref:Uncharacterized protein n=1 Tax=Asanoa ishikariensis TaxID=137265 RepID=A0A1H3URT5_9ACTN|nr:hypothetical protein [Asanoa ishikariensis]SDZ65104.1 hypothetical protein SAMN05421684_7927 [Asanoa ishikariensis]
MIGGEVPIAVWRLDNRDETGPATAPARSLESRLAQRLILVYTRRGDAVIDLDDDPQLKGASIDAARTYLSITDPSTVADLDSQAEPVSLIVLRWPPRRVSTQPTIGYLFAACRLMMGAGTCVLATVSSAAPGTPGTTYAAHIDELLPAARAAGLTHVLQIVAVTGPSGRDEYLYNATPAEAEAARHEWSSSDHGPTHHVDLLVFSNLDRRA